MVNNGIKGSREPFSRSRLQDDSLHHSVFESQNTNLECYLGLALSISPMKVISKQIPRAEETKGFESIRRKRNVKKLYLHYKVKKKSQSHSIHRQNKETPWGREEGFKLRLGDAET